MYPLTNQDSAFRAKLRNRSPHLHEDRPFAGQARGGDLLSSQGPCHLGAAPPPGFRSDVFGQFVWKSLLHSPANQASSWR